LRFWNFSNKGDGTRVLRIEGPIAEYSWWGDEVTPAAFRQELFAGSGDIVVYINSEGGDVFAANDIYNMLKEYGGKVTVKILSLAASAASVIAMAGDAIMISPVGSILIHDPMAGVFGNESDLSEVIELLRAVKENIITAYELKTHLPRDEISRMMADEGTMLPAVRAVELKFADEIMYLEGDDMSDCANFSRQNSIRVTNAATQAMISKVKAELAQATEFIPAEPLYQRLDLIQRTLGGREQNG